MSMLTLLSSTTPCSSSSRYKRNISIILCWIYSCLNLSSETMLMFWYLYTLCIFILFFPFGECLGGVFPIITAKSPSNECIDEAPSAICRGNSVTSMQCDGPLGRLCRKSCRRCEAGRIECKDKSSLCEIQGKPSLRETFCQYASNKKMCPKTCRQCTAGIESAIYLGCFADDSKDRAMTGSYRSLGSEATTSMCTSICSAEGYDYAGLQSHDLCYCGNEYDKHGQTPESDCNTPCFGNSSQSCGGVWHMSVYSLGTASCSDKAADCRQRKADGQIFTQPLFMYMNCTRTSDACFVSAETRCYCEGDPHCTSFDKRENDYQGMCIYTFLRDQCKQGSPDGIPTFEINVDMKRWRTSMNSVVGAVTLRLHDSRNLVVTLTDGKVRVNGGPVVLPHMHAGLIVYTTGSFTTLIDLELGLFLEQGKGNYFVVKVRESFMSRLCGLCGNYDGDPSNDWTLGPACALMETPGAQPMTDTCCEHPDCISATHTHIWGNSWLSSDYDCDVDCKTNGACDEPDGSTNRCSEVALQQAAYECGRVMQFIDSDPKSTECKDYLPSGTVKHIIDSCVFDFCSTKDQEMVCNAFQVFSLMCIEKLIPIEYSSETNCKTTCADNEVYGTVCGECELNCDGIKVDPFCMEGEGSSCHVGCHCYSGYRHHNGSCISVDMCEELNSCEVPFREALLPDGSGIMGDTCSTYCACSKGTLDCVPHRCPPNSQCEDNFCICQRGFIKSAEGVCQDIDECVVGDSLPCKMDKASCVNTIGSFYCKCDDGYDLNENGLCMDIDECNAVAVCSNNTICINLVPGYQCACRVGYRRVGHLCVDVDECEAGWDSCDGRTTKCVNTDGSFMCSCIPGYTTDDRMVTSCFDINECIVSEDLPCGDNSECENLLGSYKCVCKSGYTMTSPGLCTNIDECLLEKSVCCQFATCTDTPGSFTCTCQEGFEMDEDVCVPEIVPCDPEKSRLCALHANCSKNENRDINECHCQAGYIGNGYILCEDLDECVENRDHCSTHAHCNNTLGSYTCTCHHGYEGNGRICRDINECHDGTDDCDDEVSTCMNKEGGFECLCNTGYWHYSSAVCEDINECEYVRCGEHAECVNTPGSFKCQCSQGFSGSCENCINDNECALSTGLCAKHALCIDTIGSYTCQCPSGFTGDGVYHCEAIDACKSGTGSCGDNSSCIFLDPGYTCECFVGYIQDEHGHCVNEDECKRLVTGCSTHATCTDTQGSYECKCKPGYAGNGVQCTPSGVVCSNGALCDMRAVCVDGKCLCMDGYREPGLVKKGMPGCIDIDECEAGTHECNDKADCINAPGTYLCECKEGFSGDGVISCLPVPTNPCSKVNCGKGVSCDSSSGEAVCRCAVGYRLDPLTGCYDKNECKLNQDECPVNSKCVNEEGSYTCLCETGYSYDRNSNTCQDINECGGVHLCSREAECVNTVGGYKCRCYNGETGDGKVCNEPDSEDCLPGSCGDNSYCSEVVDGKAVCQCQPGYRNTGPESNPKCTDANECEEGPLCSALAICTNTLGSYECNCLTGYHGNGLLCEDINECLDEEVCVRDDRCVNTPGSYNCVPILECGCGSNGQCSGGTSDGCECNYGYKEVNFLPYDRCQDIDECISSPCEHVQHRMCVNSPGSYTCMCAVGTWNGSHCAINLCDYYSVSCHKDASCSEVDGYPVCTCNEGFLGDGFYCDKHSEYDCRSWNCSTDANSVCVQSDNGPKCICKAGYSRVDGVCTDIDECSTVSCGSHGNCINRPGFYECVCDDGYRRSSGVCANYNECTQGGANCHSYADCVDTEGGYNCTCRKGYIGDGHSSCLPDCTCIESGPCHINASCLEDEEAWSCSCKEGFEGNGTHCTDISECDTGRYICPLNSNCENIDGGYICICKQGYSKVGLLCVDIDECATNTSTCGEGNATCRNTAGSYTCVCTQGFRLSNGQCVDLDECSGDNIDKFCPAPGKCTNQIATYTCQCPDGYDVTSTGCEDIDECLKIPCDPHPSNHIICENLEGGYTCICQKGYENGINGSCTNIDECAANDTNECDIHADCDDIDGSYQCNCTEGYVGNGFYCMPVSQPCRALQCNQTNSVCVTDANGVETCICKAGFTQHLGQGCISNLCDVGSPCPPDSLCVPQDSALGFTCQCGRGFTKDGLNCTNINECDIDNDVCGHNSQCEDIHGSYVCHCGPGYSFNGVTCANVDECVNMSTCPSPQRCVDTEGAYTCICPSGYHMVQGFCENVNECWQPVTPCHQFSWCTDTSGSYYCQCMPGYEGNGITCSDMDECLLTPPVCPLQSECINTAGSYDCECHSGYRYDGIGTCQDIDECIENVNICGDNSYCANMVGKYQCFCHNGFQLTGNSCVDIDECAAGKHGCHRDAVCFNSLGSHYCLCKAGFQGNGYLCESICGVDTCQYPGQRCRFNGTEAVCECTCTGSNCLVPGYMCATDGQTYPSYREFDIARCQAQSFHVEKAYWGRCQASCERVRCHSYERCSLGANGPVCRCPECTDEERILGPVCSTESITYSSLCALLTHACFHKRYEVVEMEAACATDAVVGAWSVFGDCSVTCGSGVQTRHRQLLRRSSDQEHVELELVDTTPCYLPPCPHDQCSNHTCVRPGAECLINSAHHPYCACPTGCKKLDKEQVCGLLYQRKATTFYNMCTLRRVSCLYSLPYTVLHQGACTEESRDSSKCRPLPMFERVTVDTCQSKYHVPLTKCGGTCGHVTGYCCVPSEYMTIDVPTLCGDIITAKQVNVTTSCQCVKKF